MWKIILLAWIAGISVMGKTFSLPVFLLPGLMIFSVGSGLLYWYQYSKLESHHPIPWLSRAIFILALGILAGTLGYRYADHALEQRLDNRETDTRNIEAVIYIRHIDERSEKQIRQKVEVLDQKKQPVQWWLTFKNIPEQPIKFELGEYYRIYGEVMPAHGYAMPGVFDQEKWFIQQNIMASVKIWKIEKLDHDAVYRLGFNQYLNNQQGWINGFLLLMERQRYHFRTFIQNSTLKNKGLILALLTGDKSLLSSETEEQFQRLGISHLLAISGPHVLIFAALVSWVLQTLIRLYCPKLYLSLPRPYLLVFPFCFCVLLYSAFVGFEIPALRTLLITLLGSSLLLLRQKIQALSLLLASASLLLWIDPFSVLSAAFWLSFGACFILLRIYESINRQPAQPAFNWKQRVLTAGKLLIESQGKIFIALFPLVLIFFKQVSWIAPLTNILVIPLLGAVVVPLDILAACLSYIISPLGLLLFHCSDLGLNLGLWILEILDHLFNPQLQGIAFTPLLIVSLSIGLIILYLPRSVIPKAWALLCFVPVFTSRAPDSDFKLTILDVGQGQAILLQSSQQKIMLDTGGYYDETKFSIGQQILAPFLFSQGIARLDRVLLTHLDQDHSGALLPLSQKIKIDEVIANTQLPETWNIKQSSPCREGQSWSYQNFKVQVLSPGLNTYQSMVEANPNEYSCVLYVQLNQAQLYRNFLIMGDAGWPTEYELMKKYPELQVDVLVLGHHGSKHSSAYSFLKYLHPKLAIASAGQNNRYGHPTKEVKVRLKALDIPLLLTAQTGNIEFYQEADEQINYTLYREQWKWLKIK